MEVSGTIRRVICGLIEGNVPMECFGAGFGIHEGRSLQDWIGHERREFDLRRRAFGIDPASLSIRIDRIRCPGSVTFSVIGGNGQQAYQDTWGFNADGLMIGNGSQFEIVTKLHFDMSGRHRRALAIRSPRGSIVSVVPIGVAAHEATLHEGLRAVDDDFSTFTMSVEDDNLKGLQAKFRIRDNTGTRSTETVWMRGVDESGFAGDLYPVIDGRSVVVPGSRSSWAMTTVLLGGARVSVDHPRPGRYEFEAPVELAILTDSLDNDWRSSAV